jgi:NADP-dependent 3-hydroxy acid dehydrogenase YdfG
MRKSSGVRMAEWLDGTAALITGASSGIGEATARTLARHGAAVAARRKDRLDGLVEEIEDTGGRAIAIEAVVTDRSQAAGAVQETVAHFGRLDTLFNNAGVMLLGPAEDAPIEEWDRMVDLNVKGLLYTAHAALPHLLAAAEDGPRRCASRSSSRVRWPRSCRATCARRFASGRCSGSPASRGSRQKT